MKSVHVLDPWFYAYEEEFNSGELKVRCPLQIISSEHFHPLIGGFDSWKTTKAVCDFATSKGLVENVTVLKTGHVNQTDVTVTDTWTLCILLSLIPTKTLHKTVMPGIFDCGDELLSILCRSHNGRPLMAEIYLLNTQLMLQFQAKLDKKLR